MRIGEMRSRKKQYTDSVRVRGWKRKIGGCSQGNT